MKILILNGPNLNLLGKRQPEIYGNVSFDDYFTRLQTEFPQHELVYFQSNHEGALIDFLQENSDGAHGLVINAGGLTHTSVSLADAVANLAFPSVEVHISNIFAREEFRHHSYLSPVCKGLICGLGLSGYSLAISYLSQTVSS
jgi:3-dehydroquinate dehydratase-2